MTTASEIKRDPGSAYAARLLGAFELTGPGGITLALPSRRARALIAYLMLTPPHAARRETLAGLLWSERGEEQARASLRQLLLELKDLTGEDKLLSVTRVDVRLAATAYSTDLDAFDRAARDADAGALARMFADPGAALLGDLHDLGPGFDDWLSARREQHREACRAAALHACAVAQARGDADAALRLARLVALADPLDEAAAVAAMRAAAACGDVSGVRRLHAALQQALHTDLGVAPSRETNEAYRRLIEGSAAARPPSARAAAVADAVPSARRRGPVRRRWAAAAALAAGLTVAVAAVVRRPAPVASQAVVAVEPMAGAPSDRAAQTLSAGLASVIARDLVGTGTAVLIADPAAARADGRALVVDGQAAVSGGEVHASVRLSVGAQHALIWSSKFDRPANEIDQMVEQVALQVARELHCAFGSDHRPDFFGDADAARLQLAACDAVGTDFDEAARYSAQVVARAPRYARGWAELAAGTAVGAQALPPAARVKAWGDAERYGRRALALDRHQGLAYFALALTRPAPSQWAEREQLLQAGLAADPDCAEVNSAHAADLAQIGRLNDALIYSRRAFAADHFLPGKLQQLAALEIDIGALDEAARLVARGETLWPHHPWFDALAWRLALRSGDVAEARRRLAARDDANQARKTAEAAFLAWRAAPSRRAADHAAAAIQAAAGSGGVDAELVQLMALIGRVDDAYGLAAALGSPADANSSWFQPDLALFRADPRFMALAARLGLTGIWRRTNLWPDFCAGDALPYRCATAAALAEAGAHQRGPA